MKIKHLIPLSTLLCAPLIANAAGKHVHGEAELFIALEGKQVLIEMESPADNIIGFEHKPSNAKQKQIVKDAIAKLQAYSALVEFDGGNCKQTDADIESPFEEHEKHDKHDHGHKKADKHDHGHKKADKHDHHDHGHKKADKHDHHDHGHKKADKHDHHDHGHEKGGEDSHSDFHITYTLQCENTAEVKNVTVTAFQQFTNFEKIQLNWVSPKGQSSQVTTPSKASATIQ